MSRQAGRQAQEALDEGNEELRLERFSLLLRSFLDTLSCRFLGGISHTISGYFGFSVLFHVWVICR